MTRLARTLAAIDAANDADPDRSEGTPAARLYGERMTEELERLRPGASDELRIAARGQHVERWTSPRAGYPEGRKGYLDWRRDLAQYHARRVGEIMSAQGYDPESIDRVGRMIRKEGIKRDDEVQALEDVICFTFLRWYFQPFADGRDTEELERIVTRTARKMSAEARARALVEFDLPEPFAAAFAS
ncbi:hypothetical protein DEA8626_01573 [Defluviimonas aquaemixtae]|uniref:DUF4202 domain-containing protein n=1 Tax=Albidovulum aquaemixtae TaxID=1542388 RepID=A0A2R8B667_9RHOB|nr:DUF4202 domain-containing protein [Defluviimonas aquaemixtae]SPH18043.1 hypothetical protein DEA8626_01573 [Defluviimonas aquaemixtae]